MAEKVTGKESYFPSIILDTNHGNEYAVKIVSKVDLKIKTWKEKLVQEINIHKTLNHKHIVSSHQYFEDESNIYMVLELCYYLEQRFLRAGRK
jgi:serine/threonine protein kinase